MRWKWILATLPIYGLLGWLSFPTLGDFEYREPPNWVLALTFWLFVGWMVWVPTMAGTLLGYWAISRKLVGAVVFSTSVVIWTVWIAKALVAKWSSPVFVIFGGVDWVGMVSTILLDYTFLIGSITGIKSRYHFSLLHLMLVLSGISWLGVGLGCFGSSLFFD